MTRDEILTMEAGREMNDLIATEVMGWEIGDRGAHYVYNDGRNVHFVIAGEFEPSEDIAAAWEVVEKMVSLGYHFDLFRVPALGRVWDCSLSRRNDAADIVTGIGELAPIAICRAALLAVMEVEHG